MISQMYKNTATTEREQTLGGIKKAYTENLSSFMCHVQPIDAEVGEGLSGEFGKDWIMFCPVLDIKEGDKVVVDGTNEYRVSGVEIFDMSRNPHLEVLIRAWR
jgi:hypothetical protein